MRCLFVNTGLDSYLSEKIRKSRIHDNVQQHLPERKLEAGSLYKPLEKGNSFLAGFTIPAPPPQHEELRKSFEVEEKERDERAVSEAELLEALDFLDAIAVGRR